MLGGLALCNSTLVILVPWYIVTRLGVGVETDAFFASSALPQLVFLLVSGLLAYILVPLLATEEEEAFQRDAWSFFLGVTLFFSLLAVALLATVQLWVPLLVSGFSPAGKALTVSLTRVQLISMVLNASIVVLWSIHHARQRFIWVEFSPVFVNLLGLLLLAWTLPRFGIKAAAWTIVFNNVLKLALLLPIMGRVRRPDWKSPAMMEAWRRLKPFLLGQLYRTDPLVDRFLTSLTAAGGLSLLYVGQQIYTVANQILNKAVSSPMAPRLAIEAKEKAWQSYRRIYRGQLLWMASLLMASALGLFAFGRPLLQLTIGHGGMTGENVRTLWLIMLALLGILASGTIGQITAVAFYAMGDTKTPTRLSIVTFLLYVPLKVIVFLHYGLIGLAVTTSLYFVTNFGLQLFILERTIQHRESETRTETQRIVAGRGRMSQASRQIEEGHV